VIISNADLKRTFLDMVGKEHVSEETKARIEKFRMALPIFCVYLGLDIDLSERLPNANFWWYSAYDVEGMYQDCFEGRMPAEMGLFITMASVKDRETKVIAAEGHTSMEVMMWVPPDYRLWAIEEGPTAGEKYRRNPEYRSFKEEITEAMIDGCEKAIPGIKEHIVWKEAATPITQERYTLSTEGTSYGIEMATDQFGPARPAPRTEIDGLYLVGASTMFGHGIVGVMRGGIGTAGAVLDRDLMAEVTEGRVFGDASKLKTGGPDWDPMEASR
jgi:phytoene dehydrogenase-like protein